MSIQGILKVQKKSGNFNEANQRKLQRENYLWIEFKRWTEFSSGRAALEAEGTT